jgi:hypothetical protein
MRVHKTTSVTSKDKRDKPDYSNGRRSFIQSFDNITSFSKECSSQREEVIRTLRDAVGLLYVSICLLKRKTKNEKGVDGNKTPVLVPKTAIVIKAFVKTRKKTGRVRRQKKRPQIHKVERKEPHLHLPAQSQTSIRQSRIKNKKDRKQKESHSTKLQPPHRRSLPISRVLARSRFKSQLLTLLIRIIPLQRRVIRVLRGRRRDSTIVIVMMLRTSIFSRLVAEDCECKVGASDSDEDEQNRENLFRTC